MITIMMIRRRRKESKNDTRGGEEEYDYRLYCYSFGQREKGITLEFIEVKRMSKRCVWCALI